MPQPSPPKAVLWMLASVTSFLVMSISGRATTKVLNVFEVLELRSVIGLVMLLPLVFAEGGFSAMRSERPLMHVGRNLVHYSGQAAWLYALTLIPLAQLISIEFTTPIWTALLAFAFLGETLNGRRIAAILLGIVGVAVIVRPSPGSIEPGHLYVLGAAMSFGISLTMVKSLTRTDSVVRIIFWMLVVQSVIGLWPAIHVWTTPPGSLWPWIVLIAFTGSFSHFALARALSYADALFVTPIDFLRVPISALIGWALYQERIDVFTAAGAALILGGNLLNIQRRSRPERSTDVG